MTITLAMLFDALLGEPKWLWSRVPHPAVLMGRLIGWIDQTWNQGDHRKVKGIFAMVGLVSAAFLTGAVMLAVPGNVIDVIVLAILLAQRSLSDHVLAVGRALRLSLTDGRESVAQIVGRDTADMDQSAVVRSAIESGAENLSDGIIAPLFWFFLGGLPGLLIYKITNTADSMIGYVTPRHHQFGWAAAKLDDVLNWVPARITALLMLTVSWRWDLLERVMDDASLHRSPNAGWPEAALAHVLNFAVSGPRSYNGEVEDFPFVNASGIRDLSPHHIDEAVMLLWKVWGLVFVCAVIPTLLFWIF